MGTYYVFPFPNRIYELHICFMLIVLLLFAIHDVYYCDVPTSFLHCKAISCKIVQVFTRSFLNVNAVLSVHKPDEKNNHNIHTGSLVRIVLHPCEVLKVINLDFRPNPWRFQYPFDSEWTTFVHLRKYYPTNTTPYFKCLLYFLRKVFHCPVLVSCFPLLTWCDPYWLRFINGLEGLFVRRSTLNNFNNEATLAEQC